MLSHFLILLLFTWTCSQLLKLAIKYNFSVWKKHKQKLIQQTLLYYSGPPSTHAALIASGLAYLGTLFGYSSETFLVGILFSLLWLYEIVMQRQRVNQLLGVLASLKIPPLKIHRLREYYGHSLVDIALGLLVGISCFYLLSISDIVSLSN